MKIIIQEDNTLLFSDFRKILENHDRKGVLIWIKKLKMETSIRFIKLKYINSSNSDLEIGWSSLYYDREEDCSQMSPLKTKEDLIGFVKDEIKKNPMSEFYFFNSPIQAIRELSKQ